MPRRTILCVASVTLLGALPACTGSLSGDGRDRAPAPSDDEGPSRGPDGDPGPPSIARPEGDCALPARRIVMLTPRQYDATVAGLLPDMAREAPSRGFVATLGGVAGFSTNAEGLRLSAPHVDRLYATARELAAGVDSARWPQPCVLDASTDEGCARDFVRGFGARAFRRPLTDEETDRFVTFHRAQRERVGAEEGLRFLVRAFLMSPHFLFRTEIGEQNDEGTTLTAYERAQALSYMLADAPPDDALRAAAENGRLSTREDIRTQVERMLQAPPTAEGLRQFFSEYLGHQDVRDSQKEKSVLADPTLLAAMAEETRRFVDHVLWESDGTVSSLMAADYSVLDARLASFYGVAAAGEGWQRTALPDTRRGLLTQAGIMANLAHADISNPVARGGFIRSRIFCQALPDPPPDADVTPIEDDGKSTARQRLSEHARNPECKSCHDLMDPLGLSFEVYDAAGRHRTQENGLTIDSGLDLTGTSIDGHYAHPVALAAALADASDVHACVAQNLFFYLLARSPDADRDRCWLDELARAAGRSDRLLDVVAAVTTSDAFLLRALDAKTEGGP